VEGDGLRHDLIFGYGSLVASRGRRARLDGYRRVWGVAMDNTVDLPGYKRYLAPDGSRPALCVAFLDVVPDASAGVDGLCVAVDDDALARLDDRERNYERVDVTGRVDVDVDPPARVWTYVGRADSRARFAAARDEGRCAIPRDYLAAVEAGVRATFGDAAWADFAPTDGLPVRDLRRVDLP
jgi:cation transport regulator ChaC